MNGLKNIQSTFKHAHTRGGRYYAFVEHVRLGKATVRLTTNGARLTNLNVVGDYINEGDLVVVDYGGIKPVVKPTAIVEGEVILDTVVADALEIQKSWESQDHGACVYSTTNQVVSYNYWTPVTYNATQWDTDNFWNSGTPERLTAANDGYYLVLFAWAWQKTGRIEYEVWNAWDWSFTKSSINPVEENFEGYMDNQVRIMHSVDGEIYRGADMKPLRDVIDTKDTLFFAVEMRAGEFIYAEARTRNPFNESRTLIGSATGVHPRLVLQHRFDL